MKKSIDAVGSVLLYTMKLQQVKISFTCIYVSCPSMKTKDCGELRRYLNQTERDLKK